MAPAWLANMAPPFARYLRRWNRPIHARWFGTHKTTIGFFLAVATGALATAAQAGIAAPALWNRDADWLWIGLGFGFGVAGGDLLKSFFKRRFGIAAGRPWLPFDQIDFALGSLLLVHPWVNLGAIDVVALLAVTFCGDLVVNRLAFALGIKETPW
nr:CDP-archaeol synthase [Tahibacter caeni]